MASQLVIDVRCQKPMHSEASYGQRGSLYSLSHRQTYGYRRIPPQRNFQEHNMEHENGAKRSTNRGRQQAQKLHRLGFSYLSSSFLYILIKVKAFYNGFLEDVAGEPKVGIEAPLTTETYFSVPVLPN